MKLAYFLKDQSLQLDARVMTLLAELGAAGFDLYPILSAADMDAGTDMLLSLGGDGTFLSAAAISLETSVPVLGVNFGRLGFLSQNRPEDVPGALSAHDYNISLRGLVKAWGWNAGDPPQYALNEVCVMRKGYAMLGVDVSVDGLQLPTYWADGLIVATASGSTAYSLSAGGPICTPDSKVLILAPISPHNLNIRPLIVPDSSRMTISFRSRDPQVRLTADNRSFDISAGSRVEVCAAPGALRRVELGGSNFIGALRSRLHWGSDIRNEE